MFIDDLASTYIALEKIKPLLNKVSQKQKSALEQLNQNVTITDLVVRTPFAPYGEAPPSTNSSKEPVINRLQAYIGTLFAFANEYHHAFNCEEESDNYQLKKDKRNNITRLSTHEFSFYTEHALTLNEFQLLLSNIETMTGSLTPNTMRCSTAKNCLFAVYLKMVMRFYLTKLSIASPQTASIYIMTALFQIIVYILVPQPQCRPMEHK